MEKFIAFAVFVDIQRRIDDEKRSIRLRNGEDEDGLFILLSNIPEFDHKILFRVCTCSWHGHSRADHDYCIIVG